MPEIITSPGNSKIKLVRALQTRRRNRTTEEAFVAEGVRLVEESLKVRWPIEFILYDESLSDRGSEIIKEHHSDSPVEIFQISPSLMSDISDTETPQGILAVLKRQFVALPDLPSFIVIADKIRDPGNMGTLIRTAEAAGADALIASPGTVDAFSPKVIRAGMGAHFHLPIRQMDWNGISSYLGHLPVFLAESDNGTPLWNANFQQPCAILIGGEAFGASLAGQEIATHKVTIPMKGRSESLNAAVAAGILIAEVLRQRYGK